MAGLETALRAELGGERPAEGRDHRRVRRAAGPRPRLRPQHDLHGGGRRGAGAAGRRCGRRSARRSLLGTPAEESAVDNAGGKIHMLARRRLRRRRRGDDGPPARPRRAATARAARWPRAGIVFEFHGKPAHAAAAPHLGINALDAVDPDVQRDRALRQQVRADVRIHGIITHGGDAPNIIPKYAAARFRVRAADLAYMDELVERVVACRARRGAQATGCRFEHHDFAPTYENMVPNAVAGRAGWRRTSPSSAGRWRRPARRATGMGSTDFGNVSRRVPAFCPYVQDRRRGDPSRTPSSSSAPPASETAHRMILDSAKAMAMAAIDLLADPSLIDRAKEELNGAAERVEDRGRSHVRADPLPHRDRLARAGAAHRRRRHGRQTMCVDAGGGDAARRAVTPGGNPQTGPVLRRGRRAGRHAGRALRPDLAQPAERLHRRRRRRQRRRSRVRAASCRAGTASGRRGELGDRPGRRARRRSRSRRPELEARWTLPLDPMLGCFGVAPAARRRRSRCATSGAARRQHGLPRLRARA